MHLKNFSFIENNEEYFLSPVYDFVSVKLAMLKDTEEMVLSLNGKKNNINIFDL